MTSSRLKASNTIRSSSVSSSSVPSSSIPSNLGKILIPIARSAITLALAKTEANAATAQSSAIAHSDNIHHHTAWLQEPGASFVTLRQNKKLRGSYGSPEASQPLMMDVKNNALAAAFKDPRFSPITLDEVQHIDIEVSLLSDIKPLSFASEQDAIAQLQSGIDGIVFEFGHYRSTFLPQVWEKLPHKSLFLAMLKHKAGLNPDFWHEDIKLYQCHVTKWQESELSLVHEDSR